jgi:LPXTG-motif cell wall-anchored protein
VPRLVSGQVNPAGRPLLFADQVKGGGTFQLPGPLNNAVPFPPPFDIQVFGNDFIGATISASGTAWGSFTQDCGPSPSSPGCMAQKGQTRGYAGHVEGVAVAPRTEVPAPVVRRPAGAAPGQLPATGPSTLLAAAGLLLLAAVLLLRRTVR